jgi:hypothetical protein
MGVIRNQRKKKKESEASARGLSKVDAAIRCSDEWKAFRNALDKKDRKRLFNAMTTAAAADAKRYN